MEIRGKNPSVLFALMVGTLPLWLVKIFWQEANHNPIVFVRRWRVNLRAVYAIALHCTGCVKLKTVNFWKDQYRYAFSDGFPDWSTVTALVYRQLYRLAYEKVSCESKAAASKLTEPPYSNFKAKVADRHKNDFKLVFDAAKLLGFISPNETYKPFFKRAVVDFCFEMKRDRKPGDPTVIEMFQDQIKQLDSVQKTSK